MPTSRPPADPLQKLLDEAESELSRRLHEACEAEAHGVTNDSTAEIRRLEDTLLAAAMAAERTIVARRHLQDESTPADAAHAATQAVEREVSRPVSREPLREPVREATGASEAASTEDAGQGAEHGAEHGAEFDSAIDPVTAGVRQFEDEVGRRWRAWPVVPDVRRVHQSSLRSLGEYRDGWICFEALDDSGRRRLPARGRRWSDLPAEELPTLLAQAINVPARKGRTESSESSSSSPT